MKNSFILLFFLTLSFCSHAQRMVLLEEFTNAGCVPCHIAKPQFDTLVAHNRDKVLVISYHAGWPGKDGFYRLNEGDNQSRVIYYQVTGLPWSEGNGQFFFTTSLNQTIIDTLYSAPEIIKLSSTHSLNANKDSLEVSVEMNPKKSFPEGYSLFIAVVGSEYRNVLRQFITPVGGTPLKKGVNKERQSLHFKEPLINISTFHWDKMKVICFVQDTKTKQIIQATESKIVLK